MGLTKLGSGITFGVIRLCSLSHWYLRWSKSREPTSCSATTAFSWGTASTFPWWRRSGRYLTDCLWSLPMATATWPARRRTVTMLWRRTSRDPRLPPLLPPRTPKRLSPNLRSCQPKTSYIDWTCKSNSQSRRLASSKKRKWGKGVCRKQRRLILVAYPLGLRCFGVNLCRGANALIPVILFVDSIHVCFFRKYLSVLTLTLMCLEDSDEEFNIFKSSMKVGTISQ